MQSISRENGNHSSIRIKLSIKHFTRIDGTTGEVPMMKQVSDYKVFSGDGFILAEFPYGQGNFVMDIILPDGQNGINSLTAPSE